MMERTKIVDVLDDLLYVSGNEDRMVGEVLEIELDAGAGSVSIVWLDLKGAQTLHDLVGRWIEDQTGSSAPTEKVG